jgi:hypothetical protein
LPVSLDEQNRERLNGREFISGNVGVNSRALIPVATTNAPEKDIPSPLDAREKEINPAGSDFNEIPAKFSPHLGNERVTVEIRDEYSSEADQRTDGGEGEC